MPTERWQRLDRIFALALGRPVRERDEFLARECGSDTGLYQEITALLSAAEQSTEFLVRPALELLAREVAQGGWTVREGDRVGNYAVERRIGSGGMGEVWRGRDDRLGRPVAIKLLLPQASESDRVRALEREARAVGGLNHENVVTVYDVGEHAGAPYLVTELLEGESLRARLRRGPLELEAALDVALQMARGLAAAHSAGVVHRDLKPENVFLTRDGRVKILDFGLARRTDAAVSSRFAGEGRAEPVSTAWGTAGYMAPEQARGGAVDPRTDLFGLGVVLHEMLAGRRPDAQYEDLPAVPLAVVDIARRCRAELPEQRFATAAEVVAALEQALNGGREGESRRRTRARRLGLGALALVVGGLLVAGGAVWRANSRVRWANGVAAPEVQRLLDQREFTQAFLLARKALEIVPDDALLRRLWIDASVPEMIVTEPAGAEVAIAPYAPSTSGWLTLGVTPLADARIPRGLFRIRVAKSGYRTIEGSGSPGAVARYRLDHPDAVPSGMVRVVGGRAPSRFGVVAELDDFFIDQDEVTNRKFAEFVEQGGYSRRELWREPFLDGERTLAWDEAMSRFRDASGRPGPATWRGGKYPENQPDFPVSGVSWYEASAYAVYAGKSLPTLFHWFRAAALGRFTDILNVSNFGGQGPARVGSYHGLGPFGTHDMAGNVREWSSTAMGSQRFVLGGAFNDPKRLFTNSDVKNPFERTPGSGFRLARYARPPSAEVSAPISLEHPRRDARKQTPVSDEVFATYRRQFAYDPSALNAASERPTTTEDWQKQSVEIDTAYGERMHVYVFIPKNAKPPYQAVIFFPPEDVFVQRSSRELSLAWGEPIVRSGRAFVYPVYKGTYERRAAGAPLGDNEARELRVAWSRDLGRTIDYLETRGDVDRARLTFYAVHARASAVVLTALEPRLRASVLQGAGISIWGNVAPEIDAINYAPRVRIPTLMLSARGDFDNPVETAQRPLFELLGTPLADKQHIVLALGHGIPIDDGARQILPWLDRYLGAVGAPAVRGR